MSRCSRPGWPRTRNYCARAIDQYDRRLRPHGLPPWPDAARLYVACRVAYLAGRDPGLRDRLERTLARLHAAGVRTRWSMSGWAFTNALNASAASSELLRSRTGQAAVKTRTLRRGSDATI